MHTSAVLIAGVAFAITAIATSFPSTGGINTYCTNIIPYDQEGDSLIFMASCAASGAHDLGTTLSTSTLDINNCLANDGGIISPRAHGGALGSCKCDFGTHVCGTGAGCATTTARCVCKAKNGAEHVNQFDIAQILGVGYNSGHHFVLYCSGIYGSWQQCVKEGETAPC